MYWESILPQTLVMGDSMLGYLQAFVAIPLVTFQTPTLSSAFILGTVPALVPNVSTTGVYSETVLRVVIAKWTAVTFGVMIATVYCQCMYIYWARKNSIGSPESRHQFPLLDFAVGSYNRTHPVVQLLSARGELDSRLYRENLERQILGVGDSKHRQSESPSGMWSGTKDGVAGYCYR